MNKDIDFKKIWAKQKAETPDVKKLYHKAKKFKRNHLYKLIITNILLLITCVFIGFIWFYYQPELLSTKIGIILVILAMVIFLVAYNRILPLLLKNNITDNNKEFLEQLIKLKEKQLFQQTKILSVYFILLSLGIGLYLFEYVSKMTSFQGVIAYGLTIVWIAFNWFYLRPKIIKKQQEKTNKLIRNFKKLNEQLID